MWDNNRSRRPLEEYDFELQLMKQDFPKFRDPNVNNFQNFQNDQHFQSYDRNGDFNSNFNNFDHRPHPYQNSFESQYTFDQHQYGVGNQFENNFGYENDFQIDQNLQNNNLYPHLEYDQNCSFPSNFDSFGYESNF